MGRVCRRPGRETNAGVIPHVLCQIGIIPTYQQFAPFYDAVMGERGSDGDWAVDALRRHAPAATTLLELGCGTGLILGQLGHVPSITGVDHSPCMLDQARSRVPRAALIDGDITSCRLGQRFDAVICVFDTLNHLPTFDQWRAAFATAHQHLADGGLFLFDVNTVGKLRRLSTSPPWVQEFDGHLMIMDVTDASGDEFTWDIKVFEHIDGTRYELHHDRIVQLGVALADMKAELAQTFDLVEEFDELGAPPTDASMRAYFVYRKTGSN
jgi:SAM-dependent methyltransferase